MNERIRQLAEQAGIGPWGITIDKSTEIFQKFAELIVQACAAAADEHVRDGDIDIAEIIRRHFGVEK